MRSWRSRQPLRSSRWRHPFMGRALPSEEQPLLAFLVPTESVSSVMQLLLGLALLQRLNCKSTRTRCLRCLAKRKQNGMVFKSSMVRIQAAANNVNTLVLLDGAAGLTDFYDQLDEEHTPIMERVRWHCDSRIPTMQIEFGAEISEHGLPYLTFTYECD